MHKTIPDIPPAAYTDPKRLLGVRLVGLGRRWRKTLDTQLATNGLSDAAWTPLMHLLRLGDGLSQTELAAAIGLEGSSLVRLLDILEGKGWVERRADAADRRSKRIFLTAEGHSAVDHVRATMLEAELSLLQDLEDSEVEAMLDGVNKIRARIEQMHEQHSAQAHCGTEERA